MGGSVVEHLHEFIADDLALLLRLLDSGQSGQEALRRIDVNQLHVECPAEQIPHPLRLIFAQQAVVDENTVELLADRLVNQRRRHRGVDAAGKTEDHIGGTDFSADLPNLLFDKGFHRPVADAFADVLAEVADDGFALRRMHYFRVELDAVEIPLRHMHRAELRVAAGTEDFKASRRHFRDFVPVGHPHLDFPVQTEEQIAGFDDFQHGLAVFPGMAAGDLSAQRVNHQLQSVADAQHRNAEFENSRIAFGGMLGVDTGRAAGKNDAFGILRPDRFGACIVRHDFTVDPAFADPSRNQLTVL